MSTTLSHQLTYDAPLSEVHAMLMDPGFRERVCDAQKAIRRTATVTEEGSGHHVVVDQALPTQGLPSFAKKIVGEEITMVQDEHWADEAHATVDVSIPGKPGQMAGTIRLVESGGVTTESVDMQIKVSIPLVGGKLEGLVSDMLLKALKSENTVGRAYLAG